MIIYKPTGKVFTKRLSCKNYLGGSEAYNQELKKGNIRFITPDYVPKDKKN